MTKVVPDTNILVSALIKKVGKPAQILRSLGRFVLLTSEEILAELEEVLHRRHIQHRYHLSDADIAEYLTWLRTVAHLVPVPTIQAVITDDPDDDKFLACAIEGGAAFIVSGDPHLLDLEEYQGIRILTPAAFLNLLERGMAEEA